VRKYLLDGVTVSDLCEEHGLYPTLFRRWQKEFSEGGAAAFANESNREINQFRKRRGEAERELGRKKEVFAEVMEKYVRRKRAVRVAGGHLGERRAPG
jgi:transposase-like protein